MDKIDKRALRSLLGLLREHGVTRFSSDGCGEVVIELGPAPPSKARGESPTVVDPVISGHLEEADPLEARLNALSAKRAQQAEQKRAARG